MYQLGQSSRLLKNRPIKETVFWQWIFDEGDGLHGGGFAPFSTRSALFWRRFRAVCGHTPAAAGAQAHAVAGGPSESLAIRTRLQAIATYWPWAFVRSKTR